MQSKKNSLFESITNVLVGYFVAFIAQIIIFPVMGIHVDIKDNIVISLFFTCISIIRSYCIRRFFNYVNNRRDNIFETINEN